MTQQEQQEFMESLEVALSWMRAIQERLKANDNTQGPRDALEARLRETEVRCFHLLFDPSPLTPLLLLEYFGDSRVQTAVVAGL